MTLRIPLITAWDDITGTPELERDAIEDEYEAREDDRICDDFEAEVGQDAMDHLRGAGMHTPVGEIGRLYDLLCDVSAIYLSGKEGDDDRCVTCGEPLPPYPGWWPDECARCENEGMTV